jgi:hypothetical protein
MWEFVEANWQSAVVLLIALMCPLMHVFGHGHRQASTPGSMKRSRSTTGDASSAMDNAEQK